jgi:hypothetical protein
LQRPVCADTAFHAASRRAAARREHRAARLRLDRPTLSLPELPARRPRRLRRKVSA